MKKIYHTLFILAIFPGILIAKASDIRAGTARKVITPNDPVFLTGYASREKPATGKIHDLWAKALVLEESKTSRVVILTTDLLGLSHEISDGVAEQVYKKHGIDRSRLLLNSSHTHSGPMVWPCLSMIADYSMADQQIVSKYTQQLISDLVGVIDSAVANLSPAQLSSGLGSADFAMNRREPTAKGTIINGVNKNGPVDHTVPVLKVSGPEGTIKAILFGYACHNTTIFGDNYLVNGDYAGFAQIELEKAFPGSTAMFVMGCAGDQNPYPRGTVELAVQHGKELANAVQDALNGTLQPVNLPIRTSYTVVNLDFKPLDVKAYQKDLLSSNKFLHRRAKLVTEAYNRGWDLSKYPYPVQAVRFGNDLTILALSGEVVIDYNIRAKSEYRKENLWVAGYSNEVMCYIPSKRVLKEGGYEANESMIYYGMIGPFAENVEEEIFGAIRKVMKKVGARK